MSDPSESLLRLIEAAPQVSRRHQFFLWAQGDLQRWLPHKLLVCGAYDRVGRDLMFDTFNSVPIPEPLLRGLQGAREPLMNMIINLWKKRQHQACQISSAELSALDSTLNVGGLLAASGYQQLLVRGMCRPGRSDEIESFFIFSAPDHQYDEASIKGLEMLFPCLHMTYLRVHANERRLVGAPGAHARAPAPVAAKGQVITDREREILLWVRDGMNNQQISEKLGISALTVKNHIQKILRKLGAANRAQAVAKAMTINVLGGSNAAEGEPF